jgi:biopolymer transport protein ExbD
MDARLFSFGREPVTSFNMTPVIDIVFQLIIFFALVFKFIEAENFPVAVPAGCQFAQTEVDSQSAATTVTIVKTGEATSDFAVGSEKISASSRSQVPAKVAGLIDSRLKQLPKENRVITLRIDKNVPYSQAQYALAGIAKSTATDIRLAVIKDEQGNVSNTRLK